MARFSALLIGNESLTRECGAQLLAHGHGVVAVVTHDPGIRDWAETAGLPVIRLEKGWEDAATALSFDWLLSIANLHLIGKSVLASATKGAVNFHDGPLPAYAGLNAPVWSILNGQTRHGITWHLIGDGVDDGDILEQRMFDIADDDTTLTLNTRCFEAAIDSFGDVIGQLETGLRRTPQDFSRRTVYRRDDRPAGFGFVDFQRGVDDVLRWVRGLDHGHYWNPMTTAKIQVGRQILNIGSAERAEGQGLPGRILAVSEDGLVVACADGAVRLTRLTSLATGLGFDPRLLTDGQASVLDADQTARLTAMARLSAPKDGHMRHRLLNLIPAMIDGASASNAASDWVSIPLTGGQKIVQDERLAHLALAALRIFGQDHVDLAFDAMAIDADDTVSAWVPLLVAGKATLTETLQGLATGIAQAKSLPPFAMDLLARDTGLAGLAMPQIALTRGDAPVQGSVVTLSSDKLYFDRARLSEDRAKSLADGIARVAEQAATLPGSTALSAMSSMTGTERAQVLTDWNQTKATWSDTLCMHQAFEAQVRQNPAATALVCDGTGLTYGALNERANRVAHVLIAMGVRPGTLIGLCAPRSLDLVIGALGIQKAGAAYVPMDPAYPADRIALYIEDSACPVIVTHSAVDLPNHTAQVLRLDTDPRIATASVENPVTTVSSADLAYMIYTSGSTGRPKGVMVEHRNVLNFFAGMDARLGTDPGTWMAVTSMSFDISVLELFWTLARGFKVVISSDDQRALVASGTGISARRMEFSLYYWGNDDGSGAKKYELLLEGAKFGDENGFCAVWTPERHFHAFGGPYPNPSVTGAAIAGMTRKIGVRAGSCVAPLHHPARIAEEWAVIDNLTNGRAGIAFASGWQPDDFVLRPENTPPANKKALYTSIDQVRRLWRGEAVDFPTAKGDMFPVRTQPRPIAPELQVWVTTAGNPDTWREAGALGANVLTHLLGQSVDEVAGKIRIYHDALRAAGHDPADRTVTLMLHTYIAATRDQARDIAREPMKDYLRSAAALIKQYAWAFPAFKKPVGMSNPMDIDMGSLSPEELDAILDFAFQRYFDDSGLFGTVEDALSRVEQLKSIGVDEVACLIDYGIAPAMVLEGLRPLAEVLRRTNSGSDDAGDYSIAAQIARHGVTHLQCTPSMARMIAMTPESRTALAGVKTLMLGGEALPGGLVTDLRQATGARILNMYGPTETTIWSSTNTVDTAEPIANIGSPLANQQMYVLDDAMQPVAVGVAGELWIGGHGVTRGYWQRPDLTAERFHPDPFVTPDRAAPWGARMYRTGDLVRWRADGKIDFLGRADGQVKLRGYRIELGEIESTIEAQPGITQCIVLAREDMPGDVRLVAYISGTFAETTLRPTLATILPEHMVPAHFVAIDRFPLTPNRKIDRKALPAPKAVASQDLSVPFAPPASDLEAQLAAIWSRILGVAKVGARDNFFALGGHSLLAVQAHREIKEALGTKKLSITDIFRFPTLGALARHLDDGAGPLPKPAEANAPDRADARNDAMARRAAMRARRGGVDA
jgi:natural product biosynthesis luciferase-like monooxygenase protein